MRDYREGEMVINFYSCGKAPFHNLSNFAYIHGGIKYNGLVYISSEHAFQAQKYIQEQRYRFSIDGDLGNWDGLKLIYKESEYDKKYKYWSKKNNIGIIAKMVTNEKICKKLGLIRDEKFSSTDELWIKILEKKYAIKYFKYLLKSTCDIYLLEFDRGAKRSNSFWGGLIYNNILYGNNQMGKYLMEIRKNILYFKDEHEIH
tara:strand:+ start:143 stop:748 length:606 start_codon:yes stop_codon:yes gene_type:complete